MERMKIEVFEATGDRFSSAPSYDAALSTIFPWVALVSHRQSQELVGVLARGYQFAPDFFGPTSYAAVYNDRGDRHNRQVALWMSRASLSTLFQHKDLYDIIHLDGAPVMSHIPEGE
jgi:hypothetical protein